MKSGSKCFSATLLTVTAGKIGCKKMKISHPTMGGLRFSLTILYIKWNFVRGSCPPFFRTVLQYCTVVQICCTCTVNKNTRRTTGTRRALIQRLRTEVLRTCTYFSTANTLLRNRASCGHLNLYFTFLALAITTKGIYKTWVPPNALI